MKSKKSVFQIVPIVVSAIFFVVVILLIIGNKNFYFWDFNLYYFASKIFAVGLNPYDPNILFSATHNQLLPYCYPPITLFFLRVFSIYEYQTSYILFLSFKVLILLFLIILWSTKFLDFKYEGSKFFFPLFLVGGFNCSIAVDLFSGNINFLEQFLIWLGFYSFLKKRFLLFSALIIVAGSFKITPILFLLFLWFSGKEKRVRYFASSILFFGCYILANYLFMPDLFLGFLKNVSGILYERSFVNPTVFSLLKDLLGSAQKYYGISMAKSLLYFLWIAIIFSVGFILHKAFRKLELQKREQKIKIIIFLSCLSLPLILPRFKDYSYMLLLLPGYFILMEDEVNKVYPIMVLIISIPYRLMGFLEYVPSFSFLWEYSSLMAVILLWGLYLRRILTLEKKLSAGVEGGKIFQG